LTNENQRFAHVKSVAVSGSESASAFWNPLTNANTDSDSKADGLRFGFIFATVSHAICGASDDYEKATAGWGLINEQLYFRNSPSRAFAFKGFGAPCEARKCQLEVSGP
jgi:hypothetical protein